MEFELGKIEGIVSILLFIIPGFVAHQFYSSIVPSRHLEEKHRILSSIIASAWLYAIISPALALLYANGAFEAKARKDHPYIAALIASALLLFYPLLAGLVFAYIQQSDKLSKFRIRFGFRHPSPRAWDHVFSRGEDYYVLATLDDGTKIGGLWHGNSFAGDDAATTDLYLARQFVVDETGKFLREVERTRGCYIEQRRIRHLEFFQVEYT
jgi:hypothetical protein